MNSMGLFDVLLIVSAVAVVMALVCRLDTLRFRSHPWPLIVLHIALAGGSASAAANAWRGRTDLQDWCIVLAAITWLVVSYTGWKEVLKPFADTVPTGIDQLDYPKVIGGHRD